MVFKDFLHPWAGDPGTAEGGGTALGSAWCFSRPQEDLIGEPTCDGIRQGPMAVALGPGPAPCANDTRKQFAKLFLSTHARIPVCTSERKRMK